MNHSALVVIADSVANSQNQTQVMNEVKNFVNDPNLDPSDVTWIDAKNNQPVNKGKWLFAEKVVIL